jgi:hypothetical protein
MMHGMHSIEVVPANIDDLNSEFGSVFKGSHGKRYNVLRQPSHRDRRSVLNDRMVTYKVSYSNSNDLDEFSWTWNVPAIVNKIFPLSLKMLFHFQNRQVFLTHLVFYKNPKSSLVTFIKVRSSALNYFSLYLKENKTYYN